jgi:adenylate cyclase
MLQLSLYGGFSLEGTDGADISLKSKKAKALLAFLALPPGKTHSREEIMALLWSDRGEAQARASLRQVLTGLRKDLGEEVCSALRITDESVSLDAELVVIDNDRNGEELLAGFHLRDPAFEDWLRDERLRLENGTTASRQLPSEVFSEKPTIAVLPLINMSDDAAQEYFADGITEDIITELSRFREFTVIGRNSTFHYKGRSPATNELAHELGARYIVQGSIRRSGDRFRLTAQLIESTDGAQIWAERYDRDLGDIFAIQDELTASIVARVDDRVKDMGAAVIRSRVRPAQSAYDLVLQSRPYRTQFTSESSTQAAKLLKQAIAIDPNCAQAYAALAFVRAGEYEEEWAPDPEATLVEARSMAEQAVRLGRTDGYAHASLAYVDSLCGDYDQALHEARVALNLNPNHVNIIMTMGWISVVSGDPESGIQHIERARKLNPNMPGFELWTLGEAYMEARRYREAIDSLLKLSDPPTQAFLLLAVSYAYLGQSEEAQGNIHEYLNRSKKEIREFPGEDPLAWRAYFHRVHKRRRREDVEHFIAGACIAGLPA